MKELHAYGNKDGTFRVEIHDKAEYLSAKGTKKEEDAIVEIPRADIELIALANKVDKLYYGELTMKEMTLKEIQKALGYEVKVVAEKPHKKFKDIEVGEIITVADTDFIVLDKTGNEVICLTKDFVYTNIPFDNTNNYANSSIRKKLNEEFAQKLIEEVGERGLCDIELDLLSLDGLDDYGKVTDKVGLLTVDMYRKYNCIIEKYCINDWWWLATPWSTPHRSYSSSVCYVSSRGAVSWGDCDYASGVRPFCIFSSLIF